MSSLRFSYALSFSVKMLCDVKMLLWFSCSVMLNLMVLLLCFVVFLRLKFCCPNAGEKVKFEVKSSLGFN